MARENEHADVSPPCSSKRSLHATDTIHNDGMSRSKSHNFLPLFPFPALLYFAKFTSSAETIPNIACYKSSSLLVDTSKLNNSALQDKAVSETIRDDCVTWIKSLPKAALNPRDAPCFIFLNSSNPLYFIPLLRRFIFWFATLSNPMWFLAQHNSVQIHPKPTLQRRHENITSILKSTMHASNST